MFLDCIAYLHEMETISRGSNILNIGTCQFSLKSEMGSQFEAFNLEWGMQNSNGCEIELELLHCSRAPA